jgi:uncharacterized protein YneF (UPF0154 family)
MTTKTVFAITFIVIYLVGVVSGMYITSQIEKKITKKNNNGN